MVYEMDMEETPLPEEEPVGEPNEAETTEPEQDADHDDELDDED